MKPVFPAQNSCTYLNTPAQGLISEELANYRKQLIDLQLHSGSNFTDQSAHHLNAVRETLAGFLDATCNLTALVPNFSIAFNRLLDGLDHRLRFLLLDEDYPSINFPVKSRGFKCKYVPIDQHLERNIALAVDTYKPHVLCLSIVQYLNGIKIDLDFLKRLKQDHPDLIIIADATQYIGMEPFRFRESGIDILAASCYKWLHASNGTAFMCFKEDVLSRVMPDHVTYNPMTDFSNQRGTFMGLFEPGHLDLAAFGSLKKAIELLQDYGMQKIADDIAALAIPARKALSQYDLLEQSVIQRSSHSSIFNLDGGDALYQLLLNSRIICAQRGKGIRIGFAYHNTPKDLKRLLEVLDVFKSVS